MKLVILFNLKRTIAIIHCIIIVPNCSSYHMKFIVFLCASVIHCIPEVEVTVDLECVVCISMGF